MERNVSGPDGPLDSGRFERVVLPHIDSAYNLARWLTRNEQERALCLTRAAACARGELPAR